MKKEKKRPRPPATNPPTAPGHPSPAPPPTASTVNRDWRTANRLPDKRAKGEPTRHKHGHASKSVAAQDTSDLGHTRSPSPHFTNTFLPQHVPSASPRQRRERRHRRCKRSHQPKHIHRHDTALSPTKQYPQSTSSPATLSNRAGPPVCGGRAKAHGGFRQGSRRFLGKILFPRKSTCVFMGLLCNFVRANQARFRRARRFGSRRTSGRDAACLDVRYGASRKTTPCID